MRREGPGRNLLAARAVAATHRDSTYALFKRVIGMWGLGEVFRCLDSEPRICCVNGNEIIFRVLGVQPAGPAAEREGDQKADDPDL